MNLGNERVNLYRELIAYRKTAIKTYQLIGRMSDYPGHRLDYSPTEEIKKIREEIQLYEEEIRKLEEVASASEDDGRARLIARSPTMQLWVASSRPKKPELVPEPNEGK